MQPDPIPTNERGIHDMILDELHPGDAIAPILLERKARGLETYGVPLQANNGRSHLQDLVEELADALVYARAEVEKRGVNLGDPLLALYQSTEAALRMAIEVQGETPR